MLLLISLLGVEVGQFVQTAIRISALHKCRGSATSTGMAVPGLAFDGDLGVAQGDQAEGQRAAQSADCGTERHEGEEHQHAVMTFKTRGFEDFDPGQPGADPERRTSQRPQRQTKQSQQRDLHMFFLSAKCLVVGRG